MSVALRFWNTLPNSTFMYQGIYIWNVILTNVNINASFVAFLKKNKKNLNYFHLEI